jgi:two-component SAPR family response regulator
MQSFKPVIDNALKNVNATKHWSDVTSVYNNFSSNKVNTDLSAYVTQKAMEGIFYQVGLEEQKIRKDPVARTTDILKKVFGSQMAQGS